MTKKQTESLVSHHLERIERRVFDNYSNELVKQIKGQHGVYALYKGERLYYVGLAKDLHRRIKQHLDNRHTRKWDRFSLYLVRDSEHIKELESLILRVANPDGNRATGRLKKIQRFEEVAGEGCSRRLQASH